MYKIWWKVPKIPFTLSRLYKIWWKEPKIDGIIMDNKFYILGFIWMMVSFIPFEV